MLNSVDSAINCYHATARPGACYPGQPVSGLCRDWEVDPITNNGQIVSYPDYCFVCRDNDIDIFKLELYNI